MTNTKSVKIAIISIYSFPKGLAPTNRILAYSKGLIENGAIVDIFIPFPTDTAISNYEYKNAGTCQGISYYYTSGRFKSRNKIFRAFSVISGYRKIIGYITSIMKIYQNRKYNYLIISNDSISMIFIYSLFSKFIKARSIFIFDEFPIPIRHKLKSKLPRWKEFGYKIALKKIDAYVSISEKLAEYYNGIRKHKTFILPVIVDVTRFENVKKTERFIESKIEYLCYMGNMELSKDDVDNIIRAFGLISNKYPSLLLYLFGEPNFYSKEYLEDLIISLNLSTRVFLMGKADPLEVPKILINAHILVSSQPDTVRASGGFPTKLGEYLMSGKPTVLSNVGENSKYFRDNTHLFLVEAGSPTIYAKKLEYIMNNYEKSLEVADNGKQFVMKKYSHSIQGKRFLDFLKSIQF